MPIESFSRGGSGREREKRNERERKLVFFFFGGRGREEHENVTLYFFHFFHLFVFLFFSFFLFKEFSPREISRAQKTKKPLEPSEAPLKCLPRRGGGKKKEEEEEEEASKKKLLLLLLARKHDVHRISRGPEDVLLRDVLDLRGLPLVARVVEEAGNDASVVGVVSRSPQRNGFRREHPVREGTNPQTTRPRHAGHFGKDLEGLGEVVDAHAVGDDVK